jgi:protein involved in sex pheromone biosynthesis
MNNFKSIAICACVVLLAGCGPQFGMGEKVESTATTTEQQTPVVVQTCDATCKAVLEHRAKQQMMTLK